MNLSFIKLDINIMDDTKIKAIRKMPEGSKIFELWIGILCLAMKSGRTGCVEIGDGISFNADTLSNHFGIDNVIVTLALQTFERFKMIEVFEDGTIFIKNFEKHQQLDKIRENAEKVRKRVEKHRKKQKLLSQSVTVTSPLRNATDKDIDKELHKEKEINIPFYKFWDLYDKKRGDREKLCKVWNKLTDNDRLLIMDFIPRYIQANPDKQFRKDPKTFLNNKSWQDEIIQHGQTGTRKTQSENRANPKTGGLQPELDKQYKTAKILNQ